MQLKTLNVTIRVTATGHLSRVCHAPGKTAMIKQDKDVNKFAIHKFFYCLLINLSEQNTEGSSSSFNSFQNFYIGRLELKIIHYVYKKLENSVLHIKGTKNRILYIRTKKGKLKSKYYRIKSKTESTLR